MELSNKLKALLSPFRYVITDKGGIRIERLLDKSQTSVIVPEGVTVIDYRAFSDAKALKKLYLPTTLVRICEDAFSGCRNLSAVHIGSLDAFLKVKIETFYAAPGSNGANFYENGKLITDKNATFQSKNELGDAYGMRKASSISAEWNEQAAGFAAYITGKTVAEATGIAVDEGGYPTEREAREAWARYKEERNAGTVR